MKYFKTFILTALVIGAYAGGALTQQPQVLPVEKLSIPESLGKIEDRFLGNSSYWVIQVQDVHAHLTAQENIAAILDHLNGAYGINHIAVEGGWGSTRFNSSWGLPSSREKQMLARALLEEEYLTGAGYAALFSKSPLELTGIEDRALYEENRQAYLNHLPAHAQTLKALKENEDRLLKQKEERFNASLLALHKELYAFENSHQVDKLLPYLLAETKRLNMSLNAYQSIRLFQEIMAKEKALDKEKLEAEAARLKKEFVSHRLSFEEQLKNEIIPADRLEHYPATRAYLEILKLQDQLSYKSFFTELRQVIASTKELLFESDAERAFDREWNAFIVLKDMLNYKATPEVFRQFRQEQTFLSELAGTMNLAEALSYSVKFYELAVKRDEVFFSKVKATPPGTGNIALVAGGFHTEGISELLKEAGISYIVISPQLNGESPDDNLYVKRLQESPAQSETLAHIQNRFFTRSFDEGFAEGVVFLRTERNVTKAVDIVLAHHLPEPLEWPVWENFSEEKKLSYLKAALRKEAEAPDVRMLLVATASDLDSLLQDSQAQRLFKRVKDEKSNVLALLHTSAEEIPAEALEGAYTLLKIPGNDVAEFVSSQKFQQRFRTPLQKQLIAVLAGNQIHVEDTRILQLPNNHAASLLFRMYLSNPTLREIAKNKLFQDNLSDILRSIKQLNVFLESA